MTDRNKVHISSSVKRLELFPNPVQLRAVIGDDRVEEQHKSVAVAKGVGRISIETPRRALRRNEFVVRGEVVLQPLHAIAVRQRRACPDVVVSYGEEVRNVSRGELVDNRGVADVQLFCRTSVEN